MQCVNLGSMVDIADEIRGNWTSIAVINKASHTQFNNNAGSVAWKVINFYLSVQNNFAEMKKPSRKVEMT